MIKTMENAERDAILTVADIMATAAKTAPKTSGQDSVYSAIVTGEDKDRLAEEMRAFGREVGEDFIIRDANNVDASECVVIIGCKEQPYGLPNCGICGFKNCAECKKSGGNCTFNITDLGVAVGSAVSVAADHRIDNRVMYSVGRAAVRMKILGDNVNLCWGIPLHASSKSIYFDRGPGAVLR